MMRRRVARGIIPLAVLLYVAVRAASPAEIRLTPETDVEMVEEGDFDTAGGLLSELLEKYLLLALDKRDLDGTGERVQFIIRTRSRRWQELPPDSIDALADIDAFEISIEREPEPTVTVSGQTPTATGYGVMHFLEEFLGISWAFPGELGLCLPTQHSFVLPEGRQQLRPWAVCRSFSGLVLRSSDQPWPAGRERTGVLMDERAFFLADDYFKSLRLHPGTVHHHMINIFPVERTVRETPEVLPVLADGSRFVPQPKRRDAAGGRKAYQAWHPCYSHPKTLETAIERGEAEFRSGQLFYSLGINDGQRVQCQCDACRRTGWPETYYQFVTNVADALRQHYPPQMVGVLAYGDVGIPPTDLQLPENVLVHVAGNRKMLWESLAPALGTYEYPYGCGYVIPNLPLDVIRENMRYYHARNLQMYYGEMYPVWAFDAPKAYIISRLLWDRQQDEYDLLRRYCDRTFGAGGEPMYAYYATLAGIRRDDARPGQFTQVWNREWPFREPLQFLYCPNDLHTQLLACLERAGDCELTPRERNRLEMVEAFTEFSAVYYEMYRLKESVFFGAFDPAETLCRARALQERKLDVFRRFAQHAEWFLGTACGADDFDDRVWPLRGLEQQLETAMATAMAAQDNPELEIDDTSDRMRTSAYRLLPLRRREHPWYKPTQHQAMVVTSADRAGSFTFQGATNRVIKDAEDPRHAGKPKAQWLHALVRDLPASAGRRFVLQVELEGQAGLLRIESQGVSRTRVHPDRIEFVRSERVMAAGQAKQVLTAVVEPSRCLDRDEARAEGVEVHASMNLQLHFLWRPDTLSSSLSGTVNFYEIGK